MDTMALMYRSRLTCDYPEVRARTRARLIFTSGFVFNGSMRADFRFSVKDISWTASQRERLHPPRWLAVSGAWQAAFPSLGFESITKGNGFEFDSDSVFDGNHGTRLEHKRRQHGA